MDILLSKTPKNELPKKLYNSPGIPDKHKHKKIKRKNQKPFKPKKMRSFIAIPCPDELKNKILEFQDQLKNTGKIKFVERENIHLTLKFLGDVPENEIKEIIEILDLISKDENNKKFKINLCGAGAFPDENYIKILWIGVSSGREEILDLHRQIDFQLKSIDFKKDKKFHPHFTIARVKFLKTEDKKEVQKVLLENSGTAFCDFEVCGFKLMRSELNSSGPIYSVVKEFEF